MLKLYFILALLTFSGVNGFYRPRIGIFEEENFMETLYNKLFRPEPIRVSNPILRQNLECIEAIRRGDLKGCKGKNILAVLPHRLSHFVPVMG